MSITKCYGMKFSHYLWQQVNPIYEKIITHPFNTQMAQGTLDKEKFLFYMEQDAYYLVGFSRALAFIAARAISSKTITPFLSFAQGALIAERTLHANFLPPGHDLDFIEPSPACLAYTQFLIATAATAPLEEAIAAVLPCFWVYRNVGCNIAKEATENNPYMRWISTYSSPEFSTATDQAINILDEVASECTSNELTRMERAFEYSTLLEWHFWDDSYEMTVFKEAYLRKECLVS